MNARAEIPKERPILFSSEMVRAILDGRKTQTRRAVKSPIHDRGFGCEIAGSELNGELVQDPGLCPYGKPGDRLWVRETTWECIDNNDRLRYVADGPAPTTDARHYKKRPSIFMPRWASRILLEITDVRVERLNEISQGDVFKEGLRNSDFRALERLREEHLSAQECFKELWESINGKGSFDDRWVWVIEFSPTNPTER